MHSEGTTLISQGEFNRAAAIYARLLSEYSEEVYRPEMDMCLGSCYLWSGNYEKAEFHLVRSIRGVDREEEGLCFLQASHYSALLYYLLGDVQKALLYLDDSESHFHLYTEDEASRQRCEFRLLKGRVLMCFGRFKEALQQFEDAKGYVIKQGWNDSTEALFSLEIGRVCHYMGDQSKAESLLQTINVADFDDLSLVADYHHVMMRFLLGKGDLSGTLIHYAATQSLQIPDRFAAEIHAMAGKAYYLKGQGREAVECLKLSQTAPMLGEELRMSNEWHLSELRKAGYS